MHQSLRALLLTAVLCCGGVSAFDGHKFAATTAPADEFGGIAFEFSPGDASSESPIVISVPGRMLANEDRIYRTRLQAYWLSHHVSDRLQFHGRSSALCKFTRPGEAATCDVYSFLDAGTKETYDYYIYAGNWP